MRTSHLAISTLLSLTATLSAGVLSASAATPAPTWTNSQLGGAYTQTVSFIGEQQTTPVAGLNASIALTLTDVSPDNLGWTFDYTLHNDAHAPVNAATLRAFNFNPGSHVTSVTHVSDAEDIGSLVSYTDADSSHVDCTQPVGCRLRYDTAVNLGELKSGVFSFTLDTPQTSVTLNDMQVEFSGVNAPDLSIFDGLAVGRVNSVVLTPDVSAAPEPAAWALMMVGVGGMGAALRSRRRTVVAGA